MLLFLLTLLNEKTLLFRSCQQESLNNDCWRHAARDSKLNGDKCDSS